MPRIVGIVVAATLCMGAVGPAHAVEFKRMGSVVVLNGPLNWGDHHVFKSFLEGQPPGIKAILLNSGGGSVEAAEEIGRRIRKKGWATVVDAKRTRCASACTAIFSAGRDRYYIGTEGLAEGAVRPGSPRGGLGYHQGSSPQSRQANGYSGGASAHMVDLYFEFGTRGAASIVDLAPPNILYVISGRTALEKGIATSLVLPGDRR